MKLEEHFHELEKKKKKAVSNWFKWPSKSVEGKSTQTTQRTSNVLKQRGIIKASRVREKEKLTSNFASTMDAERHYNFFQISNF